MSGDVAFFKAQPDEAIYAMGDRLRRLTSKIDELRA